LLFNFCITFLVYKSRKKQLVMEFALLYFIIVFDFILIDSKTKPFSVVPVKCDCLEKVVVLGSTFE
jgi:hypothetical protein